MGGLVLVAGAALPQAGWAQVSPIDQEQARIRAEREAAERRARAVAPVVSIDQAQAPELGAFPSETPCFPVREMVVENVARRALRWVPEHVAQFRGRCFGPQGLTYLVRSLQAEFLDRELVTTRAGLPEQDLATGTLRVVVVPGVVEDVRINGGSARMWNRAAPVRQGDLLDLRALEQALEQLRSVPGRAVTVDIRPGDAPGGSLLDVQLRRSRPFAVSASINNFAGERVGCYQGSLQVAELGLLGFSEVVSAFANRRVDAPGLPADSRGWGATASVPAGWWTFSAGGSANRYAQTVTGEVATFGTRGTLDRVYVAAERVIFRDRIARSSLSASLSRRWGRNSINDVEIGIQRQDVTDLDVRLLHRQTLGAVRFDGAAGVRFGLGILGAQNETDRPRALPSARYRIVSVDTGLLVPFGSGFLESYRIEAHAQIANRNLFGSDLIQVGGPYTVRGFDNDTAELGRDGFYVRQDLQARVADGFRPYALFDWGQVRHASGLRGGAGIGLRMQRGPVFVDLFGARPVFGRRITDRNRIRFGLSAGVGI